MVSAPTHDGERNDGIFDTYVRGDRIPIDVGFSEALGGGLGMPVDCELGTNCWIVNYPDAGAGAQRLDFRCNHLTYDGHKGTDFAVRDLASMYRGVAVVATADGRVLRVRDGVSDDGPEGVPEGRACGNGIVIAHDDGWETQYCHLRKWSVAVQPGEAVHRGQTLGLIGMSGRAEFPHVQLGIRRDGTPLDPFTRKEVGSGCGMVERSLWHADSPPPTRRPSSSRPASRPAPSRWMSSSGTRRARPRSERTGIGLSTGRGSRTSPSALGTDAPALVLWVVTLGLEPGDLLSLSIEGPDGSAVFSHEEELDRTQIRRLDYGGRRVRGDGWAPGVYVGEARLRRPSAGGGAERSIRIEVTLR